MLLNIFGTESDVLAVVIGEKVGRNTFGAKAAFCVSVNFHQQSECEHEIASSETKYKRVHGTHD